MKTLEELLANKSNLSYEHECEVHEFAHMVLHPMTKATLKELCKLHDIFTMGSRSTKADLINRIVNRCTVGLRAKERNEV